MKPIIKVDGKEFRQCTKDSDIITELHNELQERWNNKESIKIDVEWIDYEEAYKQLKETHKKLEERCQALETLMKVYETAESSEKDAPWWITKKLPVTCEEDHNPWNIIPLSGELVDTSPKMLEVYYTTGPCEAYKIII